MWALVGAEGELVLFFAGEAELVGEDFGGLAHDHVAGWIGEAKL